jgi:hypothetical protein
MRWARKSKTEQEKHALMDLARTWTQAAVHRERILVVNGQSARGQGAVKAAPESAPAILRFSAV